MELRADFARREVVRPDSEALWLSPMAGTERYVLDRIGEEVTRETAIVRHAALALLDRGAASAIAVDASTAYVGAAREEADRRGRTDAIREADLRDRFRRPALVKH